MRVDILGQGAAQTASISAETGHPRPNLAAGPLGNNFRAEKQFLNAVGCSGLDSQSLATILDPIRAIFPDLGPDRQTSAAETGQISPAEAGQMSAVEAAKMSSAETTQMSSAGTGRM